MLSFHLSQELVRFVRQIWTEKSSLPFQWRCRNVFFGIEHVRIELPLAALSIYQGL
jgi:hypothetical protein